MNRHNNETKGFTTFVKRQLFQKTPEKYKEDYNQFRNGQNAKRLPYLYLFMLLHRLSSDVVYLVLYPIVLNIPTRPLELTYVVYSVFYFIFLGLASYGTKKIQTSLAANPKMLAICYLLAFAVLIIDDFASSEFFFGIFNPIRFLGGALIIAVLPLFEKKTTSGIMVAYLAASMLTKIILEYPLDAYIIGSVYSAFLALAAVIVSVALKTNHLGHFLEDQKIIEQNDILKKLSTTDALTKISNRRAFDEYINRAWGEAHEKGYSISVMMMDVDHFKLYNDNFGHIEGDKCLVNIAETVSTKFQRRGDMFARFGGEEFVALVINEPGDDVMSFAENIRTVVEELKIPNPLNTKNPFITLSIGLASRIPSKNEEPYSVVELADTALYAAKQSGRNRVVADFMEITSLIARDGSMGNVDADSETIALREGLARLNAVLRANLLASFSLDLYTGIMEFPEDSAARLGLESTTISYEDFIERANPEDVENLERDFRAIMAGESKNNEPAVFRLSRQGDGYTWLSMRVLCAEDESTALGGIADITEHMRVQEIKELTIEGTARYTFTYDFKTNKARFNNDFFVDFGVAHRHVENALEWMMQFIPKQEDKDDFLVALARMESGETDHMDFKLYIYASYLKTNMWLSVKGKCARDEEGKPIIMAGTVSDITQQVRNEELNNLIIEGSSDCVFIFDLEKNVYEFSSKIYDLIHTKTRTLTNGLATWLEHIIPVDHHVFIKALERISLGQTEIFKAEYRLKGKNSVPFWVACSGKCLMDEYNHPILIAGSLINLDTMSQFSAYVDEIRNVDKLSGLPNRTAFNQDFNAAITAMPTNDSQNNGFVAMIDIDDFGNINSLYGLSVGDRLLTEYGAFLTLMVPPEVKLFHFEGNRFVLYQEMGGEEDVEELSDQICLFSSNGMLVDDTYVKLTVSIGVAEFFAHDTVDDALVNAELALRKAKITKNNVCFFLPEDKKAYMERLALEAELRECVFDDFRGFMIFYQPLYSTSLNMFIGGEALLRWKDNDGKIVPPAVIIPALQRMGIFAEVEAWIFKSATKQCAEWIEATGFEDLTINVNMSPSRAAKGDFANEALFVIADAGLKKENIFLELTEESLVPDSQAHANALRELQEKGLRIAVDDFGTGYSSLGYLRDLPVCELKIDRSFVADIETNESNREFVATIINLCHIMNYIVCVEGVERLEQARILMDLNADLLQGYYFSKPLPVDEMYERFIKNMTGPIKFAETFAEMRGII